MSKIHFNNTFSSGCVQFMAADWPATTAHKMIYLLTSYTVYLLAPIQTASLFVLFRCNPEITVNLSSTLITLHNDNSSHTKIVVSSANCVIFASLLS